MLFNSLAFLLFLPIVFGVYWSVLNKNYRVQNVLLLIASYVFYGWWDWRFLGLIFLSSLVDFVAGIFIFNSNSGVKKLFVGVSLMVNLGLLALFKYYDFFIESLVGGLQGLGVDSNFRTLNWMLPVGISFYTFQTLSYTIDIYRGKLKPTKDPVAFFTFVSFFPQLVAGPIERATNLLPQFLKRRQFDYQKAVDGLRQILLGMFKKVVIADNCAVYADMIFDHYQDYSGSTLLLGALLFAFQIYGDFSGYSDIAIGTGRSFGFNLQKNFAFPYFSRDIAEFWRRWHISLSSWFRDYVYIPLGGSRVGKWLGIRNIFIVFLISGIWHGANWTFVVWGILNAAYFLPGFIASNNRRYLDIPAKGRVFPEMITVLQILVTFVMVIIGWVFFRSKSLVDALVYLKRMVSDGLFSVPEITPVKLCLLIGVFIVLEWFQRDKEHALDLVRLPMYIRWGAYLLISIITIAFFGSNNTFIYFQF